MNGNPLNTANKIVATLFVLLGTSPAFPQSKQFVTDKTAEALRSIIEAAGYQSVFSVAGETIYSSALLKQIYENRVYHLGWIGNAGPLPHIKSLLEGLEDVRLDGLNPEAYHLNSIKPQ